MLIGKLAGPANHDQGLDGKFTISLTGEMAEVPKDDLYKFRILAANEELVEELLAQGKVSRQTELSPMPKSNHCKWLHGEHS